MRVFTPLSSTPFKLTVMLVLYSLILTTVACMEPLPDSSVYLGELAAKHRRLASLDSPRIILIGGSNVAYGINSPMLEKLTGMPVANMGTHMGLGLKYMLTEVSSSVRTGDIVVVLPEYEQFFGMLEGRMTLLELLLVFPPAINFLDTVQICSLPGSVLELAKSKPSYWMLHCRNHWRKWHHQPVLFTCTSPQFNMYGDEVGHLDRVQKSFEPEILRTGRDFDPQSLKTLNTFATQIRAKGATVCVDFPSLCNTSYVDNKNIIAGFAKLLSSKCLAPVIGEPTNFVFGDSECYDTPYHLIRGSRDIRTHKLGIDINAYLRSTKNPSTISSTN